MRILVVTPILPYPAGALRRRHDVSLLSLEAGDAAGAARALGVPVTVEPAQSRRGLAPLGIAPATTAAVWRAAAGTRADVVHVQGTFGAAAAALQRRPPDVPTVIDDGCVYHLSYERAAALAPSAFGRARGRLRAWRLRRFERRSRFLTGFGKPRSGTTLALQPTDR